MIFFFYKFCILFVIYMFGDVEYLFVDVYILISLLIRRSKGWVFLVCFCFCLGFFVLFFCFFVFDVKYLNGIRILLVGFFLKLVCKNFECCWGLKYVGVEKGL